MPERLLSHLPDLQDTSGARSLSTTLISGRLPPVPTDPDLDRARRLLDISVALNTVHDPDELLRFIIRTATDVLRCEAASLLLFDERTGRLRFVAATGEQADALGDIVVPLDGSIAGTIFRENRPILLDDASGDARHFKGAEDATGVRTKVLLGVPMRIGDHPVGVLEALNPTSGAFTEADVETLLVVSAQAAIAIRNVRQHRALREANDRLARLDQLKSDFMAVASHELRTPLAIILGFGAVLRDESDAPLAAMAGDIMAAGERMQKIIETVEEMGALQDAETELDGRPVVLQQILREAWVEAAVEEHPHRATLDLPDAALAVRADADRLRRVFVNLIENALAFTPETGAVHLTLTPEGHEAHVVLRDTGRGLAEADRGRIFEAFYQAEAPLTRTRGGLGMGLAIAQALVRLHGGRLWAESDGPGHGSTFHVRLPLHRDR